jgi:hypothetical protein
VEPALSPGVGRSDGSGRRGHILPREISGSVRSIELRHGQSGGTRLEKSAEALSRFRSGVIFDRVNHDILMSRIARRIGDKRLLGIMRRFFQDGLMQGGVCVSRDEESLGSLPSASTVRKRTSGSHPSPPVACVLSPRRRRSPSPQCVPPPCVVTTRFRYSSSSLSTIRPDIPLWSPKSVITSGSLADREFDGTSRARGVIPGCQRRFPVAPRDPISSTGPAM